MPSFQPLSRFPEPSSPRKFATILSCSLAIFFGWLITSAAADDKESRFKYQFDRQKPLIYKFNSTVKIEDFEVLNAGTIEYEFLKKDAARFIQELPKELREQISLGGNGSGWVVHPDGWIVTCAHVVDGIEQIEVTINEKNYIGDVVKVDQEADLALIKINGAEHRFLAIRTELPKLGTAAKIFGFPLASQLGSSMKMTSGSVTGRDRVGEMGIRVHLDATANPGNSGGPVTDNEGRVIGIADSILAASELSDMSFAVPTHDLVKLLKAQKIAYSDIDAAQPIAADLARLQVTQLEDVSDAVALLEISPLRNAKNWKVVRFAVNSTNRIDVRAGGDPLAQMRAAMRGPSFPKIRNLHGNLIVDEFGKMIFATDHYMLPCSMQDQASIGWFPVSGGKQDKWTHRESMMLVSEEKETNPSPFDHFGFHSHFGHFGRPERQETAQRKITKCDIREKFSVPRSGNLIEVQRTITTEQVDQNEVQKDSDEAEYSLDGELHFDPKLGCFEKGSLAGSRFVIVDGRKLEVQSSFSFQFVSVKQIEKERADQRARNEELLKKQAPQLQRMQERNLQEMKRMQEEMKKRHQEFFKGTPKHFRDDFFDDPFETDEGDDGDDDDDPREAGT